MPKWHKLNKQANCKLTTITIYTLDTKEHAHKHTQIKHTNTHSIYHLVTLYALDYVCFYAPQTEIRAILFAFYFILFCFCFV